MPWRKRRARAGPSLQLSYQRPSTQWISPVSSGFRGQTGLWVTCPRRYEVAVPHRRTTSRQVKRSPARTRQIGHHHLIVSSDALTACPANAPGKRYQNSTRPPVMIRAIPCSAVPRGCINEKQTRIDHGYGATLPRRRSQGRGEFFHGGSAVPNGDFRTVDAIDPAMVRVPRRPIGTACRSGLWVRPS